MKNILKTITATLTLFSASILNADLQPTIGANLTTLGPSVEATIHANKYLAIRANASHFAFGHNDTYDDIKYDGDLSMTNFGLLADIYPFPESAFHVSAGVYFNNNKLEGNATTTATYEIGGTRYTGSDVGTLNADVEMGDISPYLGIGWDTTSNNEGSGFGFVFNAGVMFTGSPDVSLTADGPISSDATFQANLAKERADFQNDINDFEVYPVVSIGINYRF